MHIGSFLTTGLLWLLGSCQVQAESLLPGQASSISVITAKHDSDRSGSGVSEQNAATVVPWAVLANVPTRQARQRAVPRFTRPQLQLHRKVQRFRGFMVSLGPHALQDHFLLHSTPGCDECDEDEAERTIEVIGKTAIPYNSNQVTVEGVFTLMHDNVHGLYYRLENAHLVD